MVRECIKEDISQRWQNTNHRLTQRLCQTWEVQIYLSLSGGLLISSRLLAVSIKMRDGSFCRHPGHIMSPS